MQAPYPTDCARCGKSVHHKGVPVSALRPDLVALLRADRPGIQDQERICDDCLSELWVQLAAHDLARDRGELDEIEKSVIASLSDDRLISSNLNEKVNRSLKFGDRVADKVAEFGGSWAFIISALSMISLWIVVNSLGRGLERFDPYPFILLNLVLSCTAALQAPIIMMSQNRQEAKDRLRSEQDYQTNLKAELEVRQLHDKLDFLLSRQIRRLLELQEMQMEFLQRPTPTDKS